MSHSITPSLCLSPVIGRIKTTDGLTPEPLVHSFNGTSDLGNLQRQEGFWWLHNNNWKLRLRNTEKKQRTLHQSRAGGTWRVMGAMGE